MRGAQRTALAAAAILAVAAAGPAAAQVRNWPSEPVPKPLATSAVTFPPYQVRTLANGLRVVVVEHHEQPLVSLRLLVGAGTARDPMPKLGVANMVASLLDQGTATQSAQQIAAAVDSIGGNISIGAGTDATLAYSTVLRDSLDQGLDLLSDLVRAPAFAPGDLERQREHLRSALRVSYQDPDYLATIVFRRLVYGTHPYGYPATGTPTSIERITRSDLVEYHERYFAPGNCMLAVVGDVPADEAFAAAEKAFGGWAPRPLVEPIALGPPAPTRRVVIVDVPDPAQTEVRVGHLGIRRDARDFMATDLAVRILGGDGTSRLQQLLTRRGLAYGVSADLTAYRTTGDIAAKGGTRPELTGAALRVMVDQFFRLQREQVGSSELDAAKAFLAGSFPLSIETPDDIAARVLTSLFYGVPLAQLDTFRDRVHATTPADIQRVTRAHLRPDSLSIVLVGYGPIIADELQRVGIRIGEVVALADF
ncbi:MAG TPA: pitrilysin family protein, partial [Vicinamibacterales bacterium]|nr:pitrilysin family protein [Vicinamibacterales bacterium]